MKRIIFLWFILCFQLINAAEDYEISVVDPMYESWRYRHEKFLDGLVVYAMREHLDGSLWFGTTEGLYKYDGYKFQKIKLPSTVIGSDNTCHVKNLLFLDESSFLLMVNDRVVLKQNDEWKVLIKFVGNSFYINFLSKAKDGSIWLQSNKHIWRISSDLKRVKKIFDSTPDNRLHAGHLDADGNFWFIEQVFWGQSKLFKIPINYFETSKKWSQYIIPYENTGNTYSLITTSDNKLLYGSLSINNGFQIFDISSENWQDLPIKVGDKLLAITHFQEGLNDTIWASSPEGLIAIRSDLEMKMYSQEQLSLPGISSQTTLQVFESSKNRLWIYGEVGQVYSIDMNYEEWKTYDGLNYQCEWLSSKQCFISTEGNVVLHDPSSDSAKQFGVEDQCIDAPISCAKTSHDLLWAYGSHKGSAAIAIYNGETWKRFVYPKFSTQFFPNNLLETEDKSIWLSGDGKYEPNNKYAGGALELKVDSEGQVNFVKHHRDPNFPFYIYSFAQRESDVLWYGSRNVFEITNNKKMLSLAGPHDIISKLLFDRKGKLWASRHNYGLYLYDHQQWSQAPNSSHFRGHRIVDMYELLNGDILTVSNHGVSRFDGGQWYSDVYPQKFKMSYPSSKISQNSKGHIWFSFGHQEAALKIHSVTNSRIMRSTRHIPEQLPPEVRVVKFWDRVPHPGNCSIEWDAFDPWHHSPKSSLRYSWRLNGGDWSAYEKMISKSFVNLKPGDYTFEVKVRDRAFNVDPIPARVSFVVEAPLWAQAWFIAIMTLFATSVIALFVMWIHYRHKRLLDHAQHLEEIDQVKTSFFTNISHELRTPLTVIKGPIDDLMQLEEDPMKKNLLATAKRNSERIHELVTQLLEFRKLEQGSVKLELVNDDFVPLLRELIELHKPYAELQGVRLKLDTENHCLGKIDKEKFKMIVSNLIINAIKYTEHDGLVLVKLIHLNSQNLKVIIEDQGVGIKIEDQENIFNLFYRVSDDSIIEGSGIGLNLAKDLVDLWKGAIEAESPIYDNPDRPGTRITVTLPLNNDQC